MKRNLVLAFLLGACVSMGSIIIFQMVNPQPVLAVPNTTGDGGSGFTIANTGNFTNTATDILWMVTPGLPSDAEGGNPGPRLLCYQLNGGRLRLLEARNIFFDMQLDEYPPRSQDPSVTDVRTEIRRALEEQRRQQEQENRRQGNQ